MRNLYSKESPTIDKCIETWYYQNKTS